MEVQGLSGNTLDEPVVQTIMRDLRMIGFKLYHVILPRGNAMNALRDYDLYGMLIICLVMSIFLSLSAGKDAALEFALVFVVVWCGSAIVTVNGQLLGGTLSFFQSVCVLGYCTFPLMVATIIIWAIQTFHILFKLPIVGVAWAWSSFASYGFLTSTVPENRRLLAVYPVLLFYLIIAWLVLVQ